MKKKQKPNIVLFMVDQMRADAIAALGNSEIKTPNLDRLCRRGTAFTGAFSPSPVCVPARCSMHYGKYPSATGCYENDFSMPAEDTSFMDVLTAGGWRTHGVGKCHFTPNLLDMRVFQTRDVQEELWDDWRDDDYLKWLFSQPGAKHILDPHGVRGDMYYIPQPSQLPQELHPSRWVADKALEFLYNQSEKPEENWFLFCSFVHPHPPFTPPVPWNKLYRATDVSLPLINEGCEKNYTFINKLQNRYKFRDNGFDNNLARRIKAYYYACISFVDNQIGRLLDYLEQTQQIDNTLIMFTSDHGEHLGDNRCFGKRSMHNQAANIPLLASLPSVFKSDYVCRKPVSLIDIFPTITAVAGLETPSECQGVSLADIAAEKDDREVVFSEYNFEDNSICMAVSEKWKYFYSLADGKAYLFDRINDVNEAHNLADNPEFAEIKTEYEDRLLTFLRDSGRDDIADEKGFKNLKAKEMPSNPDAGLLYQDQPWSKELIERMGIDKSYGEIRVRQGEVGEC